MRSTRTIFRCGLFTLHAGLILASLFPVSGAWAQFQDDFSDGDFTLDPAWAGDTSVFAITYSSAVPVLKKPALKLNGQDGDTSFLSVASTLAMQAEWRLWIKLSFNTSASNFARFYLTSDQPDLSGPLEGYFLQVGGANDSIGLFRQSGDAILPLFTGSSAYTGNSTNVLHLKVTRDDAGSWSLYCDPDGGYGFVLEGTCADTVIQDSQFAGIYCRYTSSNATKFYFDDLYAADLYADTIPPALEDLEAESEVSLRLVFSEVLEPASAQDMLNYQVNPGVGHPAEAILDPADQSTVLLLFDAVIAAGEPFDLEVSGVMDPAGNVILPVVHPFTLELPPLLRPGHLYVSEVMADVNPPPAGLPGVEYIELYNPGPDPVDLHGATLQPRESSLPLPFPDVALAGGGYLLVTGPPDAALLEGYGPVVGLPGFGINNEGVIILRNEEGEVLHALSYSTDTYKDPFKESGGWSLELAGHENACALEAGWQASADISGGTPGGENSVVAAPGSSPVVADLHLAEPDLLQVRFSHHMDSIALSDPLNYMVPGYGPPQTAALPAPFFNVVELSFGTAFPQNGMFTLTLTDTLPDFCGGQLLPGEGYPFVRPADAGPWDIVINEVMADEDPPIGLPGHEYVELFNVTDRHLRMQGWSLSIDGAVFQIPTVIAGPGEYLLLVGEDDALIFNLFARTILIEGAFLPNAGARIILYDAQGHMVSGCDYDQDLYVEPDAGSGGISLELTDPYNPCGLAGSWLPSEAPEGGTPGALNSVDAAYEKKLSISHALVADSAELLVVFDMKLDPVSLMDGSLFHVDHGMGNPQQVAVPDVFGSAVRLFFDREFLPGILYSLSVDQPLENCIGLSYAVAGDHLFGKAEPPAPFDAVINEVLFNPAGDGVDFIEIMNRSDRILNLRDLMLGTIRVDAFGAVDTLLYDICESDRLFLMGELVVLTRDPVTVREQYVCGDLSAFCGMGSFPSYNNDEGTVLLIRRSGAVIDRMGYAAGMHHPLLRMVEGVSLERLHPDRPSMDPTNWHSASSGSGYATPALPNSQYDETSEKPSALWVEPGIFSPDNDGVDDVATIGYRFDSPGFMASVVIFDVEGRPVRYLVNNAMLGTSGFFTWDGVTDDRRKAGIGIYVILLEAFDPAGRIEKNLVTVVLAGRLD